MGRGAVEAVWRRGQRRGAKRGAQEVRLGKPDGQGWGQVHVQLGREHGPWHDVEVWQTVSHD